MQIKVGYIFTRGQFWPLGIVVVCVCLCVQMSIHPCVNKFVCMITHPFKLEWPNLDQRCKRPWLRSLTICGMIDLDLQGQIYHLKSPNRSHFEFVCTITRHPFKLGSPNLDQRCKLPWLRSLLFCGWLTLTFKVEFNLKSKHYQFHHYRKYITTREPWIPRLLYSPDCFMVSILYTCIYI